MTQGTDLDAIIHGSPLTGNDAWWNEEADEVEGYDFIKDAALFALVGVPFKIYRLTFRPGIQQKGCEWRNDYVSSELRIAPEPVIRAQIDRILSRRDDEFMAGKSFPVPGEMLGINNGSTGFYRQCVQYLTLKDYIKFPEEWMDRLPEEGKKNECLFDLPSTIFVPTDAAVRQGVAEYGYTSSGEHTNVFHLPKPISCMRGLRYSHYDNEFTDADGAFTWYIA
jgi:hypothetical protein